MNEDEKERNVKEDEKKKRKTIGFSDIPSACYMLCSRNLHQSAYQAACIESEQTDLQQQVIQLKEIARLENARRKQMIRIY